MVHYKLTYFDFRGLGEPARLILNYANVPFVDERIGDYRISDEWKKRKSTFPHGHVPVLEVDGEILPESYAIYRYLARKYGLVGKNDFESAKIDSIADYHKEVVPELAPYLFTKLGFLKGDPAPLKEGFDAAVEKHFPTYVKYLNEAGAGFFAKSGLSWVDFVIGNFLLSVRKNEPDSLKKFPELEKYVDSVHSVLQIKEYVAKRKDTDF